MLSFDHRRTRRSQGHVTHPKGQASYLWLGEGAWCDPAYGSLAWWREAISRVPPAHRVLVVRAVGSASRSASRCVEVVTEDECHYFLKSAGTEPRALAVEQIVARIGRVLEAPVPEVALLDWPNGRIAEDLRRTQTAGLAHGSRKIQARFVEDLGVNVQHISAGDNRRRYLRLAVLFGLTCARDAQFVAEVSDGWTVWSVDHGMFLSDRLPALWDQHDQPLVELHAGIASMCRFDRSELCEALSTLNRVQPRDLVDVIGAVPREWFTNSDEPARIALYLAKRRDTLAARLRELIDGGAPS